MVGQRDQVADVLATIHLITDGVAVGRVDVRSHMIIYSARRSNPRWLTLVSWCGKTIPPHGPPPPFASLQPHALLRQNDRARRVIGVFAGSFSGCDSGAPSSILYHSKGTLQFRGVNVTKVRV